MAFLIISVVIFNLIAILIPKRISKLEIHDTSFVALFFVLIVDVFLDLKLDWYGYFEKGVQLESLLVIIGLYPSANFIFLNYFPFKKKLAKKATYILGWSAFLVLFEWASIKGGFFYHNKWSLWYSALCYPVILMILVCNLKWIRRLHSHT